MRGYNLDAPAELGREFDRERCGVSVRVRNGRLERWDPHLGVARAGDVGESETPLNTARRDSAAYVGPRNSRVAGDTGARGTAVERHSGGKTRTDDARLVDQAQRLARGSAIGR